mmetsp:Transcript_54619/g.140601  ORF Transcript_54619/g.140601 Transcript_54619/m.140601 type:complete len:216 (-) Transcript_54619:86-733(-)
MPRRSGRGHEPDPSLKVWHCLDPTDDPDVQRPRVAAPLQHAQGRGKPAEPGLRPALAAGSADPHDGHAAGPCGAGAARGAGRAARRRGDRRASADAYRHHDWPDAALRAAHKPQDGDDEGPRGAGDLRRHRAGCDGDVASTAGRASLWRRPLPGGLPAPQGLAAEQGAEPDGQAAVGHPARDGDQQPPAHRQELRGDRDHGGAHAAAAPSLAVPI